MYSTHLHKLMLTFSTIDQHACFRSFKFKYPQSCILCMYQFSNTDFTEILTGSTKYTQIILGLHWRRKLVTLLKCSRICRCTFLICPNSISRFLSNYFNKETTKHKLKQNQPLPHLNRISNSAYIIIYALHAFKSWNCSTTILLASWWNQEMRWDQNKIESQEMKKEKSPKLM